MYLLSILLFVLIGAVFLVIVSGGSIGIIACVLSPSSLMLLMLISAPLLTSAGLLKDFYAAKKEVFLCICYPFYCLC